MIPAYLSEEKIALARLLHDTYAKNTNEVLVPNFKDKIDFATQLYHGDFVLVAHGTQADPIFHYANKKALELWEMDWETFTSLPSRFSAEPIAQEDREALLKQAREKGYIDAYEGVRISKNGYRFRIKNTLLWNVYSEDGTYCGQAALFRSWEAV